MDMTYLSRDVLGVSSSTGSVTVYQHSNDDKATLSSLASWDRCHALASGDAASCTGLSSNGSMLASVGEDARLLLLNPGETAPHRVIESGGDSSEYAVVFVKTSEVLTGNMQGHLRLWDTRTSGNSPVTTMISNLQEWVRQVSCHPSQQHVVAAAGEGGTLTLWDMRSPQQPFTCISAHTAPMTEARFHSGASDHLFSCGLDGQLVHWDASNTSNITSKHTGSDGSPGLVTSWLDARVGRGEVSTTALLSSGPLPLNSLDVQADVLLAASDNEAIYVIRNVILY
uniref:Nucleoporin Nup43-like n=2 Tax=Hirondellea gigas TaxID=1518452 RepID=A0A6A7FT18_9CRUS